MFTRIFCNMLNETDTFFKMLADSTRLRSLLLMQAEGELCVCELTHALNLSQQTTLDGVRNTEPFISDRKILDNMADRPGKACCA